MTGERERMLGAIRAALGDVARDEDPTWTRETDEDPAVDYERAPEMGPRARVELFAQRCGEYRATVTRCAAADDAIRAAVGDACARHGARRLAVAPGVPAAWVPDGIEARRDEPPLAIADLDGCDGALTAAAGAIALTGTIVLDDSPSGGRRALTLVPDLHVCVLDAESIAAGVPEAISRAGDAVRERRAPITLVSGPSATSDIELRRVEGVHGPRRLEVIVAGAED